MLHKMLLEVNHTKSCIIVENDRCAAKNKCAEHFAKLQKIVDKYNVPVIHCYGITGHGKCEVDHAGSLIKVANLKEVGAGRNLTCTEEMLSLLKTKFTEKSNLLQKVFKDWKLKSLKNTKLWKVFQNFK